jgi:uncharacterized protein YxjI
MILKFEQELFKIADHINITDSENDVVLKIIGELFTLTGKRKMLNKNGDVVFTIKRKLFRIPAKYEILDKDDKVVAEMSRNVSLMKNFKVKSDVFGDYKIKQIGTFLTYLIYKDGEIVGKIKNKVLRVRNTFEIESENTAEIGLYVAFAIIIDMFLKMVKRR